MSANSSREDEAAADLPGTRYGRGAAPLLVCGFVLSLLAVPVWELFGPRLSTKPTEAATPGATSFANPLATEKKAPFRLLPPGHVVPEGDDFKRFETHLEDTSSVWKSARPGVQALLAGWGGQGNAQVVVGQDGWLFYRQAVDHLTGAGFLDKLVLARRSKARGRHPDAIPALSNLANQLRARGIRLIVMPVPVKATIYPDKLWPGYDLLQGPPQNPSFESWKRRLEARGIPVFDPTETLWRARFQRRRLQYFPGDTHWTPQGAALVGQALGDFVRLWGDLPELPRKEYAMQSAGDAQATDLVRLLGLPDDNSLYPPVLQPATRVLNAQDKVVGPLRAADVLLIGDSFGGSYAETGAGLSAHLIAQMGRPIDYFTVPNGGSWAVRARLRDIMKGGDDRLAGKKLVVYEFTARDLSGGNWIPFHLPTPDEIARVREKLGKAAPALDPVPSSHLAKPSATPLPTPAKTAAPSTNSSTFVPSTITTPTAIAPTSIAPTTSATTPATPPASRPAPTVAPTLAPSVSPTAKAVAAPTPNATATIAANAARVAAQRSAVKRNAYNRYIFKRNALRRALARRRLALARLRAARKREAGQ